MIRKNKTIFTIVITFILVISMGFQTASSLPNKNKENKTVDVVITFTRPMNLIETSPDIKVYHEYKSFNAIAATVSMPLYKKLQQNPYIKSLELDYKMYLIEEDTLDWGVDQINAEIVWGGSEDAVDVLQQPTGNGIKVAVIDTGTDYTHPDLDNNYYGGYDFVNSDADPMDDNGHGTHVSGIIAAEDNGAGVIGVAPETYLYAVKVLDSAGSGSYSNVIAGIDWATTNGMDVISMSLGGSSGATALEDALQSAYDSGIVIVAASGNDGTSSISYPAKYNTAIAVGATDINDQRASFSNYGAELEITAPGVDIYSTYLGGGYRTFSGTSMATPMVTGTVALILNKDPTLDPAGVRQILHDTALDLGSAGWDQYYGWGRVQADIAVQSVPSGNDTTSPEQVTGLSVTSVSSSQLDLSWNSVSDTDLSYYKIYRDGALTSTSTTTSHSDTGLSPSTTYTYEISAVDTSGNEGLRSSPSSGTTAPSTGEDSVHVYSIDMWYDAYYFFIWAWYDVYIEVTVHDNFGNLEIGVTVYLDLTLPDGTVISGSGDTGADGSITLVYYSNVNEWGQYTATVTDLGKTGMTYASEDNIETSETIVVY